MQKPNNKKISQASEKQEMRLTTAPVRQRPKASDFYKTSNLQLPVIKGKSNMGREHVVASRDFKRSTVRKQQFSKVQHDFHQTHKRPQTSKGSRNCKKHESQYHEQEQDDLVVTSMQEKIESFKKVNERFISQHPTSKANELNSK